MAVDEDEIARLEERLADARRALSAAYDRWDALARRADSAPP